VIISEEGEVIPGFYDARRTPLLEGVQTTESPPGEPDGDQV